MTASSNAERQRRHQRHKRGDHSMCLPGRCAAVTPGGITRTVNVRIPVIAPGQDLDVPGLAGRGQRLLADLLVEAGPAPSTSVRELAVEAARCADRLDRLHSILTGAGTEWMRLAWDRDGETATVIVDKALTEARLQQIALAALVAEVRKVGAASAPAGKGGRGGGVSAADQLAARRQARIAGAAGR